MDAVGSGSGLNSSWLFAANMSVDAELDYCGSNKSSEASEILVNENSVKRITAKVWITLVLIVSVWLTSQSVLTHVWFISGAKFYSCGSGLM